MKYLVLVICMIARSGPAGANAPGDTAATANDWDRADRAVAQLVRSQLPSGLFPYDFNFGNGQAEDMQHIKGYNLVRQAGAAFALGEYLEATEAESARVALETFLRQRARHSLPVGKGVIQRRLEAIGVFNRWRFWKSWREPLYNMGLLFSSQGQGRLVTVYDDYELAWPGATALTMNAALKYRKVTGDRQFDEMIAQWKDGLLALKVPGRGFRVAPHYLSESPYLNGEAWLALAEYNRLFPEDKVTQRVLGELDRYLLRRYTEQPSTKFYHWGTMAARVRAHASTDARFDDFLYDLAGKFLAEKEQQPFPLGNSCGSVEGLATFAGYMRDQGRHDDPLTARARDFIARAMRVNRTLQLDSGFAERLPQGAEHQSRLNEYRGAFIMSHEEPLMRVDFTQHCLNALLRMASAGLAQ